jgi:energy-coupling factor transporter ATP-binding protein EcfA2
MSKKPPVAATPIDTLAEVAKAAKLSAGQSTALRAWLTEWLKANAFAKLGQGGHAETGVTLRQVFVDLPVRVNRGPLIGHDKGYPFLTSFLAAPGLVLDADLPPKNMPDVEMDGTSNDRLSASLLIGGPGQGKSTLGQYACQLQRAALLVPYIKKMSPSEQELLGAFLPLSGKKNKGENQLTPPEHPFLPLQVNLPELATWLARHADRAGATSPTLPLILQFLADQPSALLARLRAETLAQVCANMPCLLVVDGFDEVGAEDDRKMIVNAAYEMLGFLRTARTTIKVLATTRPQGYAGELAHIGVPLVEQQLLLLDEQEALAYAAILVAAKIPGQDEQKKAMDRLTEAAQESATQRLMATPLQVTILAALVQQLGRVPRERWNLFQRYFEYTYNREIERNTYASRLLADNKLYIVQIHAHVALLLQVEAERSGGAAARMSMEQLHSVVTTILQENGIAEDDCLDLVRDIIKAAEERLVFLVTPEPNSFGFEIRSLQEFMAAWALTTGGDNGKIKERLRVVAKASMFRNVLLFAASRLYSELSDLRTVFPDEICDSVEENDDLARLSCAGALLALEILEEGAVLNQPNQARALMKRALPLLTLPPVGEERRLSAVSNKDTVMVLQEALATMLASPTPAFANITARLCISLTGKKDETWAQTLLAQFPNAELRNSEWGDWLQANDMFRVGTVQLERAVLAALVQADWAPERLRKEASRVSWWVIGEKNDIARFHQEIVAARQANSYTESSLLDFAILQIRLGTLTDSAEAIAQATAKVASQSPQAWDDVMESVCCGAMARQWRITFLCHVVSTYPLPPYATREAIKHMRHLLQNRQSGLANPTTWAKLGLPKPYPHQTSRPESETEIPTHPVQLSSVELQNIRGLHQLKLTPASAQDDKGQWVVILGQNGVGKTTLLRSLALALRNTQDLAIWPPGAFSNTWLRIANPSETGITEARISVTLNHAASEPTTHETVIKQNGSTSIKQYPEQSRARVVPLFAYGCRRGSALGGAARKLDLSENEGPEIATLFDTGADIIHAETWLTKLDSAAGKDDASAAILETVLAALCQFLDIKQIKIEATGIFITEHSGLRLPFEMLSDGYLTSAGWFLDLLARSITLAQKHHIALTPDFMQTMRGLVLIDEIDLHLHPRWQIEIISRTRELLPQMSFFVTTHNPLTLVGAKANEIWMLEREDDKIVLKAGIDTPMFLTSGQIYRRYFGIEDIYPNQLGRKMQRYGFLTGFALRNDEEQAEMLALQATLRENGIEPDWEILPQEKPAPAAKKPRTRKAKGA